MTEELKQLVWEMLNYSNLFVVILDKNFEIKLMNWRLATSLGFEDEHSPVGECWLNHIEEHMVPTIQHIHKNVLSGSNEFAEALTDLVLKDGEVISVRWFNTVINNDLNWTFSIGIPVISFSSEMHIDSLRSYFKDIILRDATMIQAVRDVAITTPGKVVENNIDEEECV